MKKMVGFFSLAIFLLASIASADMRQETLKVLDQLPHTWPESGLRAWINDGRASHFRIGDEIVFYFQAERDCYIHLVHIDSHGVLSLITPDLGKGDNCLKAGMTASFPPGDADYKITAQPPLGLDHIYVLGLMHRKAFPDDGTYADSEIVAGRVKRILLEEDQPEPTALVKMRHRVEGRSADFEYSKDDIVDYYARTRGIHRPKKEENFKIRLASHINFDFNSDALAPQARLNLDEWGKAMLDHSLKNRSWVLAGHTDDIGSENYNLSLSRRRAEAVKNYLISKFAVDPNDLSIEAFGESQPVDRRKTEEARAANRRVEFILKP